MDDQDPLPISLRVWSGIASFLSAALLFPGVQQAIEHLIAVNVPGYLVQAALMLLAGAMTWASKWRDARPYRSRHDVR